MSCDTIKPVKKKKRHKAPSIDCEVQLKLEATEKVDETESKQAESEPCIQFLASHPPPCSSSHPDMK